jgi:hypothetical protein
MEYFRDPRNQIQADFAYRLGVIAEQYRTISAPAEKDFSSTLNVCILQSLLTTCTELMRAMSSHEQRRDNLGAEIGIPSPWGLRPEMVVRNTFRGSLTVELVLRRMRNALSHPTGLDISDSFPASGYTTIPDGSGAIRQYCFVNSPDTRRGRPKHWDLPGDAEKALEKERADMPEDVTVIVKNGRFCFGRNGQPFARIFEVRLTVEEIRQLVTGLSNYLAQPIQEDWDGVTIRPLLVA